ncbi:Tn3 family transposase [Escherichia coli]|uniref:Tn3 family transposase n=1 Tax=Escherichia coli TaxID=562 RepID=UPI00313ED015
MLFTSFSGSLVSRISGAVQYVNTLMIQQVLHEPVWLSRMKAEDFRALTPLIYAHINLYGIFELDMETRLSIEVVA